MFTLLRGRAAFSVSTPASVGLAFFRPFRSWGPWTEPIRSDWTNGKAFKPQNTRRLVGRWLPPSRLEVHKGLVSEGGNAGRLDRPLESPLEPSCREIANRRLGGSLRPTIAELPCPLSDPRRLRFIPSRSFAPFADGPDWPREEACQPCPAYGATITLRRVPVGWETASMASAVRCKG